MSPFLLFQLITSTYLLSPVRGLSSNVGIQGHLIRDKLKDVANNVNEFSLNLRMAINKLYREEENYVFSPLTVFTVIASYGMVAVNTTMKEISKVLHFESLKSSMNRLSYFYKELGRNNSNMYVLNDMIIPSNFDVSQTFMKHLQEAFSIQIKSKSKSKIKSITEERKRCPNTEPKGVKMKVNTTLPSSIDGGSRVKKAILGSLLSAAYQWKWIFPKEHTYPRIFRYWNGTTTLTKKIPTMTVCRTFQRYLDEELMVDIIAIPLAGGKGNVIFAKSLKYHWRNLYHRIDHQSFTKWMQGLKMNPPKPVCIYIPKFKMVHSLYNLTEILKRLGLGHLFNELKNLCCSSPLNKSTFEMREYGEEKAERFDGGGVYAKKYALDSSFMFWVVGGEYETILLSGRIMNTESLEFSVTDNKNHQDGNGIRKNDGSEFRKVGSSDGCMVPMSVVSVLGCVYLTMLFDQ